MPSGAVLKHIKNLQCHYFLFLNKVKLETAYKWSARWAESSIIAAKIAIESCFNWAEQCYMIENILERLFCHFRIFPKQFSR